MTGLAFALKKMLKKTVLIIKGDGGYWSEVLISVNIDASVPDLNYPAGTFVQTTEYLSIGAPETFRIK